jgi:hypothetical protein
MAQIGLVDYGAGSMRVTSRCAGMRFGASRQESSRLGSTERGDEGANGRRRWMYRSR